MTASASHGGMTTRPVASVHPVAEAGQALTVPARTAAESQETDPIAARLTELGHGIEQLYETVSFGSHSLNPDGTFKTVNGRLLDWLGCTREVAIGKLKFVDFLLQDDQERLGDYLSFKGTPATPSDVEVDLISAAGATTPVTLGSFVSYGPGGTPLGHRIVSFRIDASRLGVQRTKDRLTLAMRAAALAICDYDLVRNTLQWDGAMYKMYGLADARGGDAPPLWQHQLHPIDRARVEAEFASAIAGNRDFDTEFRIRWPNGEVKTLRATGLVQRNARQVPLRMVVTTWDVTAQRKNEQDLKRSLLDKAALLREVHHRVKNNLQVVSSLLRLESGRAKTHEAVMVLDEMRGRIRSMSSLHDVLCQSNTFATVDLGQYVTRLASDAFEIAQGLVPAVRLEIDADPVQVSLDQAVACGLLANELISNCIKHAFPGGGPGTVRVALKPADTASDWCLQISDTGAGLPPDFAERRHQSLGIQLVGDLAEQVGGRLTIERNEAGGVSGSVTFTPVSSVPPSQSGGIAGS